MKILFYLSQNSCRLQNTIDRMQNDRLQYLRNLSSIVSLPDPCETVIKDKVRDVVNENQALQSVYWILCSFHKKQ